MIPLKHAQLSVHRHGGSINDYLPLHRFIDSTKELCSDNRHRILHTLWGIRRVVEPIFGPTLCIQGTKTIAVHEICERDHILPDFRGRFIPTLNDFVQAIEDDPEDVSRFEAFFRAYRNDRRVAQLMLSPLSLTGALKSLLVTHNSWFVNEILPQIFDHPPRLNAFTIAPAELFARMRFEPWMDNGTALPPSARTLPWPTESSS